MATEPPKASGSKLIAPTSTFSFTAPFPPHGSNTTSLKQRRVSLPSSPRLSPAPGWPFRDEMGLEAMSAGGGPSVGSDKPRKVEPDIAVAMEEMPTLSQEKKQRKKWTMEETQMLVDGCNKWGVGNWKTILNDTELVFDNRSPVDLKDRFRTYFPDAYKQHYPNAKTHLSSRVRSALPDGSSIFEKTRSKKRRPFTPEEDEALKRGYDKHGTLWASILKDPVFHAQHRRSTDLRDRFRNAFPDLYEAAGYKPRNNASKKKKGSGGLAVPVAPAMSDPGQEEVKESPLRRPTSRRRASTAPGLRGTHSKKNVPGSTTCSDSEESSGGEECRGDAIHALIRGGDRGHDEVTPQPVPGDPSLPAEIALSELHRSSSGGVTGHDVSTRSSCSLSEDSSQPQSWSLPDHAAQQQGPTWVATSSPPQRRPVSGDIFLSSQVSPHLTRRGSEGFQNMIGKSAWVPEDWLSANPRLETSHPDSSSSSFIGGPSPAPSSPFSFSPSSHGVMDRYDLFPANVTAHDYTSSEVGYGDRDTHSAFSEADMFNAATASFRGFTHHSNYAGDLIFAAGPRHSPAGHAAAAVAAADFGPADDLLERRMGLLTGLPGIDEIPLAAIRLEDRGGGAGGAGAATVDADMEEAEAERRAGDAEMAGPLAPEHPFHRHPHHHHHHHHGHVPGDMLAAATTPRSLTNPISPGALPAELPPRPKPSRLPPHHLGGGAGGGAAHYRSFSQPPGEHHQHAHQNAHHRNTAPAATSTTTTAAAHSLYDPPAPAADLTDLPFLDLHYYTLNNAHVAALLQDPVVESNFNAAQALDLASASSASAGASGSSGGAATAMGGGPPASASQYHSLAQAQLQSGTGRPAGFHHQRVQSAVSPEDLPLQKGDNKRKRVSWDGGAGGAS